MFLYKLLENVSLGPETHFLLYKFSSREGKITCGNYVMTRDIEAISPEEKVTEKRFYLDGDVESYPIYEEAFENESFLIKIFSITSLMSIFCMYDAIGDNFYNYGILKTIENKIVDYVLKLVDHLPLTSNGNITDYSPGQFLISKFFFFGPRKVIVPHVSK